MFYVVLLIFLSIASPSFAVSAEPAFYVPADGNGSLHLHPFQDFTQVQVLEGLTTFASGQNFAHNYLSAFASKSQNANFMGNNLSTGYFNFNLVSLLRFDFDLVERNQDILRTKYLIPLSQDHVKQTATFNNMSSKLAVIDKKIDMIKGDVVTPGDLAIVGSIFALIVAVTWRF